MTDNTTPSAPADLDTTSTAAAGEVDEAATLWAEFDAADQAKAGAVPEKEEDAPAAEVVAEPEPAADAAKPALAVAETQPQPDIWANAPAELKAAYEALAAKTTKIEQRAKAAEGRVSASQRRINELVKTINGGAQADDDNSKAARDAIAAAAEEYPEVVKPLSQALDAIGDKVSRSEKARVDAAQSELNEIVQTATARLGQTHPDWEPFLKEHGGPKFITWVEDQPRSIRDAFALNGQAIVDAESAGALIDAYKAHLGIAAPANPQATATATNPTNTLTDKRQRQLAGSASPNRTGGRPVVAGIPEDGDPDALWKMWDEHDRRKARA